MTSQNKKKLDEKIQNELIKETSGFSFVNWHSMYKKKYGRSLIIKYLFLFFIISCSNIIIEDTQISLEEYELEQKKKNQSESTSYRLTGDIL